MWGGECVSVSKLSPPRESTPSYLPWLPVTTGLHHFFLLLATTSLKLWHISNSAIASAIPHKASILSLAKSSTSEATSRRLLVM